MIFLRVVGKNVKKNCNLSGLWIAATA